MGAKRTGAKRPGRKRLEGETSEDPVEVGYVSDWMQPQYQQILIIIKPECGRVPVNPEQAMVYPGEAPAEPRLSPVMPRWRPGKSRQRSGEAPVYRNSAENHRGYSGNRPRQSYGNAPV
ncbi:hypothetical protein DPMN_142528 [Dreissena polymorpha]|uniref:Uncharacterized protein n=2 Tax=Dreissena polymorpha TaxID=45954 RepID=A0A9D4GFI7_DREPO|nr:hypothetical protein DPMN_142528 [Dreissena polymorpha]